MSVSISGLNSCYFLLIEFCFLEDSAFKKFHFYIKERIKRVKQKQFKFYMILATSYKMKIDNFNKDQNTNKKNKCPNFLLMLHSQNESVNNAVK